MFSHYRILIILLLAFFGINKDNNNTSQTYTEMNQICCPLQSDYAPQKQIQEKMQNKVYANDSQQNITMLSSNPRMQPATQSPQTIL